MVSDPPALIRTSRVLQPTVVERRDYRRHKNYFRGSSRTEATWSATHSAPVGSRYSLRRG
jgi:hypothetical protein